MRSIYPFTPVEITSYPQANNSAFLCKHHIIGNNKPMVYNLKQSVCYAFNANNKQLSVVMHVGDEIVM